MMYRVYFVNFRYFSQHEAQSLDGAKSIARRAGFESVIYSPEDEPVMSFCPMIGFRTW